MKFFNCFFVLFISLAVLLTAVTSANAEGSSEKSGLKQSDFFSFGAYVADIDKLNAELSANGIVEIPEWFYSIGLNGKRSINKNTFFELDGNVLIRKEASNGLYKSSLMGTNVVAGLSYLCQGNKIDFYPMIGVGIGFLRLKIADHSDSDYSFDDALKNPRKELSALNTSLIIDIGVSTEYKIKNSQNGDRGFIIGARFGYQFAPLVSEWKMGGKELGGGPDIGIHGFYLKMMIGQGKYY